MEDVSAVWYIVLPICLFISIIGCCCCKWQESKTRTVNRTVRRHRRRRAMRRTLATATAIGDDDQGRRSQVFVIDDSPSHPQLQLPVYSPRPSTSPPPPPYSVNDLPLPAYDPPSYDEALNHPPVSNARGEPEETLC